MQESVGRVQQVRELLGAGSASERLQAALTVGTHPEDAALEPLIERCAVETDFYVRDMLTWALTRLSHELVLERVIAETSAETPQARSQSMHTLSKLRDPRGWRAVTAGHLHDPDTEVARVTWRTAVALAPEHAHAWLVAELITELGRGNFEVKRSLSRALAELGDAAVNAVKGCTLHADSFVAQHAAATLQLIEDPESTFTLR